MTEKFLVQKLQALMRRRRFYPSNRIILSPRDGAVLLFHSVFHAIHKADPFVSDFLSIVKKDGVRCDELPDIARRRGYDRFVFYEAVAYLIENHVLLPSRSHLEQDYIETVSAAYANTDSLSSIYLLLTTDCNLRCGYCGVRTPSYLRQLKSKKFSKGLLKSVVRFAAHKTIQDGTRKTIVFFGGEPSLEKELICFTAQSIAGLGSKSFGWKPPKLGLVTNGTLVDEDFAALCRSYDIDVGVTIASTREPIARRIRPPRDGQMQSFQRIAAGMKTLEKYGALSNVVITVTSQNIEYIPELLIWLHASMECRNIVLNFVIAEEGSSLFAGPPQFSKHLDRIYDLCSELGFVEQGLEFYRNALENNALINSACAATSQQMVIDPDGYVSPCAFMIGCKGQRIKMVDGYNVLASKLFRKWKRRTPWNIGACSKECDILSVCGGKCAYRSFIQKGDIFQVSKQSCELNHYLFQRAFDSYDAS